MNSECSVAIGALPSQHWTTTGSSWKARSAERLTPTGELRQADVVPAPERAQCRSLRGWACEMLPSIRVRQSEIETLHAVASRVRALRPQQPVIGSAWRRAEVVVVTLPTRDSAEPVPPESCSWWRFRDLRLGGNPKGTCIDAVDRGQRSCRIDFTKERIEFFDQSGQSEA
jgi:hypothetical protein